ATAFKRLKMTRKSFTGYRIPTTPPRRVASVGTTQASPSLGPTTIRSCLIPTGLFRRWTWPSSAEMTAPGIVPSLLPDAGANMYRLIERLYRICRSITGEGTRQTLRILQDVIPLTIEEVPSGTEVFDWVIPKEWNVRDAYIKDSQGNRIVDFNASNLHLV